MAYMFSHFSEDNLRVLQGIPNTAIYLDDILLTGPDDQQPLHMLGTVLRRLEDAGLHLKWGKCAFMRDEVESLGHRVDGTGDLVALKKQNFTMKEGISYRVKIFFRVNRDIVAGLKYIHHTSRKGLRVDQAVHMVGSYGPRAEEHEFITPVDVAPKGILVRGSYQIKSRFIDDDKTDHLSWEWNLCIKKDWDE
ncbi:rho GDP-dissociation inhibitor 3 [Diretmus argenteus]